MKFGSGGWRIFIETGRRVGTRFWWPEEEGLGEACGLRAATVYKASRQRHGTGVSICVLSGAVMSRVKISTRRVDGFSWTVLLNVKLGSAPKSPWPRCARNCLSSKRAAKAPRNADETSRFNKRINCQPPCFAICSLFLSFFFLRSFPSKYVSYFPWNLYRFKIITSSVTLKSWQLFF